jgi:pimeloyl-ACP methyl ester carboxylesterase
VVRPKATHAIAVETLDAADNLRRLSPSIRASAGRSSSSPSPACFAARPPSACTPTSRSTLDLPGTGHFVQFEKTDDVVRTIRRAAGQ